MATVINGNSGADKSSPDVVHNDDRSIVENLAQLQDLHNQLNSLRSLLPRRLLAPITAALHPNGSARFGAHLNNDSPSSKSRDALSPEFLFQELRRIARDGVEEVEQFKKSWHTESMEKLWERAKNMEAFEGGQGNDVWMVDYAEMLGKSDVDQVKETRTEQQLDTEMEVDPKDDEGDLKSVVEEETKQHPTLKADIEGEGADARINLRVGGMRFKTRQHDNAWVIYDDADGHSSDLQNSIIKQVNFRSKRASLRYLMDMMASYADVKTRPCNKCSKVIDSKFRFPCVRKDEEVMAEKPEEKRIQWLAYHEDCT